MKHSLHGYVKKREGAKTEREGGRCDQPERKFFMQAAKKVLKKEEREGLGCFFNTTQKKENIIPLTSNLAS